MPSGSSSRRRSRSRDNGNGNGKGGGKSSRRRSSRDSVSMETDTSGSRSNSLLYKGQLKENENGILTLASSSSLEDDRNNNRPPRRAGRRAMPPIKEKTDTAASRTSSSSHARSRPISTPPTASFRPRNSSLSASTTTKINFLNDPPQTMTYGRRIALSLMNKPWYNPAVKEEEKEKTASKGNKKQKEKKEKETLAEAYYRRKQEEALKQNTPNGYDGDHHFTSIEASASSAKPNLAKAWAYFEHVTLSRYIVEPKANAHRKPLLVRAFRKVFCKGDKKLERAEPNENELPTRLYSPIFTPHKQLGDFGLGIGLYFSTLRALVVITLLAGLANLHNIIYFQGTDYLPEQNRTNVPFLLRGSAICANTKWVPCPTCNCDDRDEWAKDFDITRSRCGWTSTPAGQNVTLALRNDCDAVTRNNILTNYLTFLGVFIMTILLGLYLRHQEILFDEDEQTAQDYSIVIKNPPPDATDPEEWRKFFRDACGARVTVCTIAVDNDLLVQTLVERREKIELIRAKLGPNAEQDLLELAHQAAKRERERSALANIIAFVVADIPELFSRLVALNAKVQGLAQLDYPATRVFISFETENDQRAVLSNMSVGSRQAKSNDTTCLDHRYLFRGEKVLRVVEPDEPNTIRWQDLNVPFSAKFKQQVLTTLCNFVAMILIALIVRFANDFSSIGAAVTISIANSIFPAFAKLLVALEQHASEGTKQTSLYVKIAAFRWVNTAIIITIITPFTDTLRSDKGLIEQIYTLFFSEIVTTNAIQLLEPMGHIKRHFLAPRAATQDAMNLNFLGYNYELAERYTNMTKILFLTLWYCSIYPAAFFMCSLALFVNYFSDRFSLMRTWIRAPHLGTHISKFSRLYFFSLAVMAMAVLSSYFWSGFPFDNLCEAEPASDFPGGVYTLTRFGETVKTVTVDGDNPPSFRYCLQNFFQIENGFPFVAAKQPEGDEWMNDDQEYWTTIYGWAAVGIMVLVLLSFLYEWISGILSSMKNSYKAVGEDQNIPFSEVPSINAYIPQVASTMFAYPLLACNVEGIDEELFDWNDPDRPHSYYDLTNDADHLLNGMDMSSNNGFSFLRHWPPEADDGIDLVPSTFEDEK